MLFRSHGKFLEKELTTYDKACQGSYSIWCRMRGIWLSPCPSPPPACPIASSSLQQLSLRKPGKLRRKEAYRPPDFYDIYENCDLISCPAGWTIQPGPNHNMSNRTGPSGNLLIFKHVSVCGDRSFLIAAASPSVARSKRDPCKAP